MPTKVETTHVIVCPAYYMAEGNEEPVECQAVYCYDNTERNPVTSWIRVREVSFNYWAVYDCLPSVSHEQARRMVKTFRHARLQAPLVSVDFDHWGILKVVRTITVQDDIQVVEMMK